MTDRETDTLGFKEKVRLYLNLGRFDAAEKLLKAAIAKEPPSADLHNMLGLTCHKQSKFPDALKEFRRAVAIDADFVEALLNLSVTLCDLSRYDEAKEAFSKMTLLEGPSKKMAPFVSSLLAEQHVKTAKMYEDAGLTGDAIQEYRKSLTLFESTPDVRLSLAKIYLRSGQDEKADKELEETGKKFPKSAEVITWRGIVNAKIGRKSQARSFFEKAQQIDPNSPIVESYLKISEDWLRP